MSISFLFNYNDASERGLSHAGQASCKQIFKGRTISRYDATAFPLDGVVLADPLRERNVRSSLPNLTIPFDDELVGAKFLEAHGPAGMQLVRADPDLRAHTELPAVGEPS